MWLDWINYSNYKGRPLSVTRSVIITDFMLLRNCKWLNVVKTDFKLLNFITQLLLQLFWMNLDLLVSHSWLQCVARVIEEEMFGVDNLCWISATATLEASRLAEFLILQTGLTAFGKAYYRTQNDLVPNVSVGKWPWYTDIVVCIVVIIIFQM